MANLQAIRAGLAANLSTVPGLTAYDTIGEALDTPAAVVGGPRLIEFGRTLGRFRTAQWTIPIRVYVGDPGEVASQDELAAYLDMDNPSGIVGAIESDPSLGGAAHAVRVVNITKYGTAAVGAVSYLAFEVTVEVLA